jgi:translation elongation factor EF-4
VTEVGIMQPNQVPVDCLRAGVVGCLCGSIKDVLDARVGDTITLSSELKWFDTSQSLLKTILQGIQYLLS